MTTSTFRRRLAAVGLAFSAAASAGACSGSSDKKADATSGVATTVAAAPGTTGAPPTSGAPGTPVPPPASTAPGPVRVGERASYTAATEGVEHSRWLAPDGGSYEDEPTLFIEPTSDGTTTVRLLGQSGDGDVAVAELRVTVRA